MLSTLQIIIRHTYDQALKRKGGAQATANIELKLIQCRQAIAAPRLLFKAVPIQDAHSGPDGRVTIGGQASKSASRPQPQETTMMIGGSPVQSKPIQEQGSPTIATIDTPTRPTTGEQGKSGSGSHSLSFSDDSPSHL